MGCCDPSSLSSITTRNTFPNAQSQFNFSPWHFTFRTFDDACSRSARPGESSSSFLPRPFRVSDPPLSHPIPAVAPLHLVVSKFCPRSTFPEVHLGHGLPKHDPGRRARNRLKNPCVGGILAEVQAAKNTLSASSVSAPSANAAPPPPFLWPSPPKKEKQTFVMPNK